MNDSLERHPDEVAMMEEDNLKEEWRWYEGRCVKVVNVFRGKHGLRGDKCLNPVANGWFICDSHVAEIWDRGDEKVIGDQAEIKDFRRRAAMKAQCLNHDTLLGQYAWLSAIPSDDKTMFERAETEIIKGELIRRLTISP